MSTEVSEGAEDRRCKTLVIKRVRTDHIGASEAVPNGVIALFHIKCPALYIYDLQYYGIA